LFRRVSTIHTYPSSPSIIEQQEIIDEDQHPAIEHEQEQVEVITAQLSTDEHEQTNPSSQCRTCLMLIEIVDQQAQQIRQYTEQISQQADLLAKFARRLAGIEEGIDEQKSDRTSQTDLN